MNAQQYEFTLSAFGDEIDDDLATQLDVLAAEGVRFLELRGAWGRNVLDLDDAQLRQARTLLDERGFGVSAVASPIGKSPIEEPRSLEQERLRRAIAAADVLGTSLIRVFSFFVPAGRAAEHRDEVVERMGLLAEQAAAAGVTLVHENERAIFGDLPQRCHDLVSSVDSPALRMAFDPANFVIEGVRPMQEAWPSLADYTTHVHIKDAIMAEKRVVPAGEGDGEVPQLIDALRTRGYRGFLTLEPHLVVAGASSGWSGADGMRRAIKALRTLIDE
jgi:sugar phosphate isomerase/epimerase